ncbi:MAG: glycosyltransferase family 39 protein [Caldilineaceae bacterium]|nr:glycosyltransferase family 39 protein [Caldilineaceae bacterium]
MTERAQKPAAGNLARLTRPLLLAGLLAGFALRLVRLGGESLWYDETVSVYLARLSLPAMLAHTAGDIHPPGYYGLLHIWQLVSRPTLEHGLEFLFAWPSLWWGVILLALLFVIGRRLLGASSALLAVWLAVFSPFQLWYSQEVRMYTLGAALGLLGLWATLRFLDGDRSSRLWLAVYVLAAAAGLYTLYYFAFTLIALNVIALFLIFSRATSRKHSDRSVPSLLLPWLLAQLAVLILWLPWLPAFLRQAIDPPVPPWRGPWTNLPEFFASLSETLGALVIGQTPPGGHMWPFALLGGLILLGFVFTTRRPAARTVLLIYLLLPMALLYLLTLLATPLYHVRYLFIYAPVFLLIAAAAVHGLWRYAPWLGGLGLALLLALSGWSAAEFWRNPFYRADDHRAAVADLARAWRPGDAILVNAGWVYPVLDVYWPTELNGPDATRPPAIAWSGRITADDIPPQGVAVIRTGSVDGDASLGWGSPTSDFFPVTAAATQDALAQLAADYPRIWHYRLYDTVSDPAGVIRAWLAARGSLAVDDPYPGRDYLRVQRYDFSRPGPPPTIIPQAVRFAPGLLLWGYAPVAEIQAGEVAYINFLWEAQPDAAGMSLSASLRLYALDDGPMIAQQDRAFQPPVADWPLGAAVDEWRALPIPAGTAPGTYALELIVYDGQTGTPLEPTGAGVFVVDGQRLRLGDIRILAAAAK